MPQLAVLFAGQTELVEKFAVLVENTDAVVVGVRNHDLLFGTQTKAVRRGKLALVRAQMSEFAPYGHCGFAIFGLLVLVRR